MSASVRIPPNDIAAEEAVVSAVLSSPGIFDELAMVLRPEHFYADQNRRAWESMGALASVGKTPDVVSVAGWLRDAGRLEQIGGAVYLASLAGAPFVLKPAEPAARIVEKYRVRQVIAAAQAIAAEGYGELLDAAAYVQGAEARIYTAALDGSLPSRSVGASELMSACLSEIEAKSRRERAPGASTGFPALDRRIGWLRPGRLYVAAARPGMGKTSFLIQCGRSIATTPSERMGFFCASLEMPRDDIGNRIISQETALDSRAIDAGFIRQNEWRNVIDRTAEIAKWPMIVDDSPGLTISMLRGLLRRAIRRFHSDFGTRLGLVAIDYLQLMGRSDCPRGKTTNEDVEWISSQLLAMAKEFEVPILLLSQLNRECEKRPDKRPMLSDLRSSGAIEQDAWAVVFLYRDDVYRKAEEAKDNQAEFILAKVRGGRTGTVQLGFVPYCAKFVNMADEDDPDDEFARMSREFDGIGEDVPRATKPATYDPGPEPEWWEK